MQMKALLADLDGEARRLRSKGTRYADFGYKERVRFERLLFLILEKYCSQKLAYEDLGGLSHVHRHRFQEQIVEERRESEEFDIVDEGFQIFSLLYDLCTAHIYGPGRAVRELGGNVTQVLGAIAERIEKFVEVVRNSF